MNGITQLRIRPPARAASPLMWFAVAGAPIAWGVQFTTGYWITEAHCNPAAEGWATAAGVWSIGLAVAAAIAAISAGVVALGLYRGASDSDDDDGPPGGRTRFLATVGLAVTSIFLLLIVTTGLGAGVLSPCHQS